MKSLPLLVLGCLFSLTQLQAAPSPERFGFTPLFNGENLNGWHASQAQRNLPANDGEATQAPSKSDLLAAWQSKDGELVSLGAELCASTDQEYGDFELMLEYQLSPGARSGLYLRGNPEIQIWDTTKAGGHWPYGAAKGSGSLWSDGFDALGSEPLVHADKAIGEWNQLRVRLIGSRTWVWINDKLVVEAATMRHFESRGVHPLPPRGSIGLVSYTGKTRWRNLYVREIETEKANQLLDQIDDEGFEAMFNSQDFTGWQGALNTHKIQDGVLTCMGNGNLFTKKIYRDFIWKLEFKVPPVGNNGLAIRYPGNGDPAYVAMTELQILDNSAPIYANLEPGQYHGSAYKKTAAVRGYLRPVGTWNHQVVRVQGNRIKVELNGNKILDADLTTVPGANPYSGFLGFAGHGADVSFKNVKIKELTPAN